MSLLSGQVMAQTAAKPKVTCKDVIAKCDKALGDKDKALELSNLAITDCSKKLGVASQTIQDRDEALKAWYHNPFIMAILGGAALSTTYLLLKK